MEFLIHLLLFPVFVKVEEQDSRILDRKMMLDDEIMFSSIYFMRFSAFFDYMFINIDDRTEGPDLFIDWDYSRRDNEHIDQAFP